MSAEHVSKKASTAAVSSIISHQIIHLAAVQEVRQEVYSSRRIPSLLPTLHLPLPLPHSPSCQPVKVIQHHHCRSKAHAAGSSLGEPLPSLCRRLCSQASAGQVLQVGECQPVSLQVEGKREGERRLA